MSYAICINSLECSKDKIQELFGLRENINAFPLQGSWRNSFLNLAQFRSRKRDMM